MMTPIRDSCNNCKHSRAVGFMLVGPVRKCKAWVPGGYLEHSGRQSWVIEPPLLQRKCPKWEAGRSKFNIVAVDITAGLPGEK